MTQRQHPGDPDRNKEGAPAGGRGTAAEGNGRREDDGTGRGGPEKAEGLGGGSSFGGGERSSSSCLFKQQRRVEEDDEDDEETEQEAFDEPDDELEEFDIIGGDQSVVDLEMAQWDEDWDAAGWDDEDVNDDFIKRLQQELEAFKQAHLAKQQQQVKSG